MSEELELVLSTLRKQDEMIAELTERQNTNPIEKNYKIFSWVQALVALVAVILSVGISYGIVTTKISSLEAANDVIEQRLEKYNTVATTRHERLDEEIRQIQLKQRTIETTLDNINKTLEEVRYDVKRLLPNWRNK